MNFYIRGSLKKARCAQLALKININWKEYIFLNLQNKSYSNKFSSEIMISRKILEEEIISYLWLGTITTTYIISYSI